MPRPAPRLAPVTMATLFLNDAAGVRSDGLMDLLAFREKAQISAAAA
jgi:hypothetical protein